MRGGDQDSIVDNLVTYTKGDPKKVTPELAKTAVKAIVHSPGSTVAGVPEIKPIRNNDFALYIPVRNQPPAYVTGQTLQELVAARI